MTTKEAAEYMGVEEWVLTLWRYTNKGPPYSRGYKGVEYMKDRIDLWLDRR